MQIADQYKFCLWTATGEMECMNVQQHQQTLPPASRNPMYSPCQNIFKPSNIGFQYNDIEQVGGYSGSEYAIYPIAPIRPTFSGPIVAASNYMNPNTTFISPTYYQPQRDSANPSNYYYPGAQPYAQPYAQPMGQQPACLTCSTGGSNSFSNNIMPNYAINTSGGGSQMGGSNNGTNFSYNYGKNNYSYGLNEHNTNALVPYNNNTTAIQTYNNNHPIEYGNNSFIPFQDYDGLSTNQLPRYQAPTENTGDKCEFNPTIYDMNFDKSSNVNYSLESNQGLIYREVKQPKANNGKFIQTTIPKFWSKKSNVPTVAAFENKQAQDFYSNQVNGQSTNNPYDQYKFSPDGTDHQVKSDPSSITSLITNPNVTNTYYANPTSYSQYDQHMAYNQNNYNNYGFAVGNNNNNYGNNYGSDKDTSKKEIPCPNYMDLLIDANVTPATFPAVQPSALPSFASSTMDPANVQLAPIKLLPANASANANVGNRLNPNFNTSQRWSPKFKAMYRILANELGAPYIIDQSTGTYALWNQATINNYYQNIFNKVELEGDDVSVWIKLNIPQGEWEKVQQLSNNISYDRTKRMLVIRDKNLKNVLATLTLSVLCLNKQLSLYNIDKYDLRKKYIAALTPKSQYYNAGAKNKFISVIRDTINKLAK